MARKLLSPTQTKICASCKHGRAAHVGDKVCHMKHCKCQAFK